MHGHVGVQQVETNATGRSLRSIEQVPSEPGLDLHLTLDAGMQAIAEEAFGDKKGALVAIDTTDGGILAFASLPTFDPNLFVAGIDSKTYRSLQDSIQKPMFNRALRGRYPPGSTVKPFIGLAGLELGVVDPELKTFCPGWYRLSGDKHKYRDWKKTGHGHVDLNTAVTQSCDVYFYDLALTLGIDRLSDYMKKFGFNYKTGVDISGEIAGIMPSREWKRKNRRQPWYPGETVITGIGQGFTLVTPLQLAVSTASMAMYGKRVQPRIVRAIGNTNTGQIQDIPPFEETSIEIVEREHWQRIIKSMTNVAHHWRGTAYRIGRKSPYKIAAKTGTAQVFSVKQDEEYKEEDVKESLRDHALFIAFAPAEDPKIAVAVIVENGGHGGSVAGPIAKKVMDYYLLKDDNVSNETKPEKS
jgi:penicillin-binding protein 2